MTTVTEKATKQWSIDKSHSTLNFKAKHLMITTVTGTFKSYDASIETKGDDFSSAKVKFSADISSVTTGNDDRDNHLRSDDFFNAEKYPHLTFESTDVTRKSERAFIIHGKITIRDVTMDIDLDVDFNGVVKDPWGNIKAGVSFRTRINRKDFGLKFHVLNDAGNMLVSDDIRIEADIQMSAI
jgi:polyisoprenoid-binding protein YceI